MNETVFGKIIRGEIPATKVYEDDTCLAFMDVYPQAKGHTLLIPKEQFGRIQYVPDELLQYLIVKAKDITWAMIKSLECDYVQLEIVGIGVPDHFHIHLIPRMNDEEIPESVTKIYDDGEEKEFAEKITQAL